MSDMYLQGETIAKYVYFTSESGMLIDPDSTPTGEVYDPDGNLVTTVDLVKVSTGKYKFMYSLADDAATGTWTIIFTGTCGSYTQKEPLTVEVQSVS